MENGTQTPAILFTREGRDLLCKQKNMIPTEHGFRDNEGITITDEQMLSLLAATHQPALNDAIKLNDRAEALLDQYITVANRKMSDPFGLLIIADRIWSGLKDLREKAGRPAPKLYS